MTSLEPDTDDFNLTIKEIKTRNAESFRAAGILKSHAL